MIPIHVVVTGRNHADYTEQCLTSLLRQRHKKLTITWIDDASDSPESVRIATEMLNTRVHRIVVRSTRLGGTCNAYTGLLEAPKGVVVMPMGGDDWLTDEDALSHVADAYDANPNIWYTHGGSFSSDASGTWAAPALHDDFRTHPFYWLPSTWRSELTAKVDPSDLKIGGTWLPSAGDVALYTPILEMCGRDRIRFIEHVIYMYRKHEQNDGRIDSRLQEFCGWAARAKPKYSRLASLEDVPIRTPHVLPFGIAFPPDLDHGVSISAKTDPETKQVTIGPY